MISLFATEQPPRLRLYLLRSHGKFLPKDDGGGNHGGAVADADVAVWSRLPEDLVLRRVLQFVPAAKLFQWQSVSRKWRQVLTSADFHKQQFMTRVRAADPSEQQRVLAFVNPRGAVFKGCSVPRGIHSVNDMSSTLKALDVDLSFVPSWFWWSYSYCVEAGGDGLVCVRNNCGGGKRSHNRVLRCVINPLTRTYKMLPNDWLPTPPPHLESAGRLLPGFVQLQAGSITVLFRDSVFNDTAWDWAVSTCDLRPAAAEVEWAAAYGSVRLQRPDDIRRTDKPFDDHFAMCNGETYCYSYCTGRVHVHAVCPGGGLGGLLEVAHLQVEHGKIRASLVAHRGSVFVVRMVTDTPGVWVIWRLERSRMAWEVVARLDRPLLHRLTRLVCPESDVQTMYGACGAGDLLCFGLTPVTPPALWPVCVVVGFNLETEMWELVHDQQGCMGAWAFQLRPDLFLV